MLHSWTPEFMDTNSLKKKQSTRPSLEPPFYCREDWDSTTPPVSQAGRCQVAPKNAPIHPFFFFFSVIPNLACTSLVVHLAKDHMLAVQVWRRLGGAIAWRRGVGLATRARRRGIRTARWYKGRTANRWYLALARKAGSVSTPNPSWK